MTTRAEQEARWSEAAAAMPPALQRAVPTPQMDWARAECLKVDPETFYPTGGTEWAYDDAREVCAACPFTGLTPEVGKPDSGACMAEQSALEGRAENRRAGFFAGTTPAERKALQPAAVLTPCGTRTAHQRHKARGEQSDPACVAAAARYDRKRNSHRASRAAA